ncbi:hypothetical protein HYN69_10555 [Gemmobacter aquarius]|uniref:Uncharacterized protein n=1 Tax=Paragemmobacter aquarius TaxID=2169400 RepID=A0A2S0UM25_9RHOB|nr:hypothetical protein [Gemmobacter aquarius]AWB48884.1 hypothetical protein HYN69_10555 [Gemmobacter aquarius]
MPLTLRFADPRPGLPKGATIFPALERVTTFSQTVNIAGADDSLGPSGGAERSRSSCGISPITIG